LCEYGKRTHVLSIHDEKVHVLDTTSNREWHQYVTLKLGPHPGLSDGQKEIIAHDYGMSDGMATIRVRRALVFYLLWNLRLEEGDIERSPKKQQIILLNRDEIEAYNLMT